MSRSPSFAGLILAAGESSRMGTDKALLSWPPRVAGQSASTETFLSATIRSMTFSTDFVLIVAGGNAASLAPVVFSAGASLIVNADPSSGQFSSLQAGLREILNRGRDAALITLVDRPPVHGVTIDLLRHTFEAAPQDVWAVVPQFAGQHGHPFIAGRELIEAFLRAPVTSTAREIEHAHPANIQYVPVTDPFVTANINTPEDYASLLAQAGTTASQ